MGRRRPVEHRDAVGVLLREIRHEKKMTQQQVADLLDRPQSYVSKYETGEVSMDVIALHETLRVLGTSLAVFTRRLDKRLAAIGKGTPPERFDNRPRRR